MNIKFFLLCILGRVDELRKNNIYSDNIDEYQISLR